MASLEALSFLIGSGNESTTMRAAVPDPRIYRFRISLQEGLAASSSTHHHSCKRHCSVTLEGLKPAFAAISKHTAKALQKRMACYPTPKKEKLAHQNYRGIKQKIIINTGI